jgi:hypothetical protein
VPLCFTLETLDLAGWLLRMSYAFPIDERPAAIALNSCESILKKWSRIMGIERWAETRQWYVLHTHLKQEERANKT